MKNNGIPSYATPEETIKWMNSQRDVIGRIMRSAGILKEK